MLPSQTKPEIETTTHNIQTKNCNISLEITFVNAREGRNFQPKTKWPSNTPWSQKFQRFEKTISTHDAVYHIYTNKYNRKSAVKIRSRTNDQ